MTITTASAQRSCNHRRARPVDMKFEVTAIPVSDVDRAKRFYGNLGWRLDADFVVGDTFRGVQFTPPGSPASIHFGKGVTPAAPGSASGLFLVVSDIEAARAELVSRGVDVSEIFHVAGPGHPPIPGPDPERRSYFSYATFKDPDGNTWLLQEVTVRLPGAGGRERDGVRFGGRPRDRAPARRGGARRAREADRRARCKLAGLVRRIHRGGAGRPGTAAVAQGAALLTVGSTGKRRRDLRSRRHSNQEDRHEHQFGKDRPPSPPTCRRRGSNRGCRPASHVRSRCSALVFHRAGIRPRSLRARTESRYRFPRDRQGHHAQTNGGAQPETERDRSLPARVSGDPVRLEGHFAGAGRRLRNPRFRLAGLRSFIAAAGRQVRLCAQGLRACSE